MWDDGLNQEVKRTKRKVRETSSRGGIRTPLAVRDKKAIIITNADFAEFQKRLEQIFSPSAVAVILYEAAKACGEKSAERLRNQLGTNAVELLNAFARMKETGGWGKIEFKDLVFSKAHGRVIVKDSFEAKEYRKSHIPVCHFIRGYLAGALSTILNAEVSLTETKCAAKGDDHCEFQIQRPRRTFRKNHP